MTATELKAELKRLGVTPPEPLRASLYLHELQATYNFFRDRNFMAFFRDCNTMRVDLHILSKSTNLFAVIIMDNFSSYKIIGV